MGDQVELTPYPKVNWSTSLPHHHRCCPALPRLRLLLPPPRNAHAATTQCPQEDDVRDVELAMESDDEEVRSSPSSALFPTPFPVTATLTTAHLLNGPRRRAQMAPVPILPQTLHQHFELVFAGATDAGAEAYAIKDEVIHHHHRRSINHNMNELHHLDTAGGTYARAGTRGTARVAPPAVTDDDPTPPSLSARGRIRSA